MQEPNRDPLALRLVVNYSHLNAYLIRDLAQVFPMEEEIRQALDPKCKVWFTGHN